MFLFCVLSYFGAIQAGLFKSKTNFEADEAPFLRSKKNIRTENSLFWGGFGDISVHQ